jgi:hypothetical protein
LITPLATFSASEASADAVITDFGVFTDCDQAVGFRDTTLVTLLDRNFDEYNFDKEELLQAMTEKYQNMKLDKLKDIEAKSDEQKQILKVAAAQILAAIVLEKSAGRAIESIPGIQYNEKEALTAVVNGANGLLVTAGTAVETGKIDGVGVIIDQTKTLADALLGSMATTKLGPQFWLLGKLYTISSIGIPAAADWIDAQGDKAANLSEIEMASSAITNILSKSNLAALRDINAGKEQIDNACANK